MSCDVRLPGLPADANKYSRGKLVVVAGSARYPGAAVLAARAAQRMGAGYTEVVTARQAVDVVRLGSPSLVVRAFGDWSIDQLPRARAGKPAAVCLGPGFIPGDGESDALALDVLEAARCPVLVDGGALAGLASQAAKARLARRFDEGLETVITPHGGEAERLARPLGLGCGDPAQLAAALARELRCVAVLKGPDTHISNGARSETMTEGTPALAKAGTGDVLAGMTAALLAQGAPAFDAAVTGSVLHARAGTAAAERLTEVSVCAEDVAEAIPHVLRALL